jgi:hypothetical protein
MDKPSNKSRPPTRAIHCVNPPDPVNAREPEEAAIGDADVGEPEFEVAAATAVVDVVEEIAVVVAEGEVVDVVVGLVVDAVPGTVEEVVVVGASVADVVDVDVVDVDVEVQFRTSWRSVIGGGT